MAYVDRWQGLVLLALAVAVEAARWAAVEPSHHILGAAGVGAGRRRSNVVR